MRGVLRSIAVAGMVLVSLLAAGTTEADCTYLGRHFSTINPASDGGDSRIWTWYGFSNPTDLSTVSPYAVGYFWSLGYGNPGHPSPPDTFDNDCGDQADPSWGLDGGLCGSPFLSAGVSDWWVTYESAQGVGSFIGGDFSNWSNFTDGCVDWDGTKGIHSDCDVEPCLDPNQCMLVLLADDPFGSGGRFVLLADDADLVGWYALNDAANPGTQEDEPIFMAPVPAPVYVDSSGTLDAFNVTVRVTEPSGTGQGRYENCPSGLAVGPCLGNPGDACIVGYKIYTQVRAAGAPPGRNVKRDLRARAVGVCENDHSTSCSADADCTGSGPCVDGWVQRMPLSEDFATSVPFDGNPAGTQTFFTETECRAGYRLHVCATLVFDRGFETPYCSADMNEIIYCPDCAGDGDCDDGDDCNGLETCSDGHCYSGTHPCSTGEICSGGTCVVDAVGTSGGAVPDGDTVPGSPLAFTTNEVSEVITMSWGPSCGTGDSGYAIYEGQIGDYYSHTSIDCTVSSESWVVEPAPRSVYYLVVPTTADREGSYGTNSNGAGRPQGGAACKPMNLGTCD